MEKVALFTFRHAHFTFLYPDVKTIDPERNSDELDVLLGQTRSMIILDGAMGDDYIEQFEKKVSVGISSYTKKPILVIYEPKEFRPGNYRFTNNINELEKLVRKDTKKNAHKS